MSEELKILFAERILLGDKLVISICEMIRNGLPYEQKGNLLYLSYPYSKFKKKGYFTNPENIHRWNFVETEETKEKMIAFDIHSVPSKIK